MTAHDYTALRYTLKHYARATHIKLRVHPGGQVTISAPKGIPTSVVESFLKEKTDWLAKKIKKFTRLTPRVSPRAARAQYEQYKNQARALAWQRIRALQDVYGMQVNRVSIRNQKTRWGSCSKKGNLNFNYRIVFLSQEQLDYVIAHELAHLREFNHSRDFWRLVSLAAPHHKRIRKELRAIGLGR